MKHLFALLLVWFAVGAALTAIGGHLFGNLIYAAWFTDHTPMAISTAFVLVALSISFFLHISDKKRHCNHIK